MPSGPTGRRDKRDQTDESVQFSLKELLKLEDERLEEQARVKQAGEAALAREREETRRREQLEAEAQARAEAETRERRRQTELEELARREAIEKAIVEQSRLEVEVRARADERERERRHELEVERLRNEGKKGQSLGSLIGAAAMGGVIMLVVGLAIHLGVIKPSADRRTAELELSAVTARERADELGRQLDEQRRVLGERDRQLADARTQLDALAAKTPSATSAPSRGRAIASPPRHGSPAAPPQGASQPDCLAGDPMCFSLKTGR